MMLPDAKESLDSFVLRYTKDGALKAKSFKGQTALRGKPLQGIKRCKEKNALRGKTL